jgi:hypothetical protein
MMNGNKIVLTFDLDSMSFRDSERLTGALAVFEELSEKGVVSMMRGPARGADDISGRKRRSDAGSPKRPVRPADELGPQEALIVDAIRRAEGPLTGPQIIDRTGLKEGSVRGNLYGLLGRGVLEKVEPPAEAGPERGRAQFAWRLPARDPEAPRVRHAV